MESKQAKKATFCIAVYDDLETLKATIKDIFRTVEKDEFDYIVVDDSNTIRDEQLKEFPEVKLIHNEKRGGVGYSLRKAVDNSKTENVFIMGCDIRFTDKGWADGLLEVTNRNPKSIVSTLTAGLNLKRLHIQGKENKYRAAHVLFRVTTGNNNKPALPFREYLECKWNNKNATPEIFEKDTGVVQIGACLGAFYSARRSWLQHINLWEHHKTWGSLEVELACASYIHGGNCLLDLDTVTGHIFKSSSSEKPVKHLIYNKLMIAYCYLPSYMETEVFNWVNKLDQGKQAIALFEKERQALSKLRSRKDFLGDEGIKKLLMPTGLFTH